MKPIKLTALFLFIVSTIGYSNINETNSPDDICSTLKNKINAERRYIEDLRNDLNTFEYQLKRKNDYITRKRILEERKRKLAQIKQRSFYKKKLQEEYALKCGGENYANKNKKKYALEEKAAKAEKNLAINQREINRIESKKNQGQKLTSEENKLLKNKENEIINENKLKNEAVLKEKKFADKKANELKNQKSSVAIKEWNNEMNKFKKHTLEYTLNNKILLNQFDIFSPDPKIDFYRMVYLKPTSSWNLRLIESYLNKFSMNNSANSNYYTIKNELQDKIIELKYQNNILKNKLNLDISEKERRSIKDQINKNAVIINKLIGDEMQNESTNKNNFIVKLIKENKYKINPLIIGEINGFESKIISELHPQYDLFKKEMNKLSSASAKPGKVK